MGLQISHCVGSKIPAEDTLRADSARAGRSVSRSGPAKRHPDFGRTFTTRPHSCVDVDSSEVFGGPSGRVCEGKSAIHIVRIYLGQKKNYNGIHSWARGYYVSTVGADEEVIRNYIRNQEKEDQKLDEMTGR